MPRTAAIHNGLSYTQIGNPPPEEVRMSQEKRETQYR